MTESERPNPENTPDPTNGAEGSTTPPPSPYVQPPMPGESTQPYAPAGYDATPQAPYPPAPQGYAQPQQPFVQPGTPQPYGQYPQQPNGAPQQPYAAYPQQPYGASQPPQPPYPGQPYYQGTPPPPKKKVWPWVLGGCLVVLLLGMGGCAGCIGLTNYAISTAQDRVDTSRDYDYSLRDDFDDTYNYDDSNNYDNKNMDYLLTLDEIKEAAGALPSKIEDGECSPGVYEVGADGQIGPGRYFLEGRQTEEGNFYVFERSSKNDSYELNDAVVYFGNYYADLEAGDVIVFMGAEDLRMYPAAKGTFTPKAPYLSGLYLVGTDLPAGTYTLALNDEAVVTAQQESAAFVMKDLDFDDDSITETKYVARGGAQTITVKEGDWLELYATTATPVTTP